MSAAAAKAHGTQSTANTAAIRFLVMEVIGELDWKIVWHFSVRVVPWLAAYRWSAAGNIDGPRRYRGEKSSQEVGQSREATGGQTTTAVSKAAARAKRRGVFRAQRRGGRSVSWRVLGGGPGTFGSSRTGLF